MCKKKKRLFLWQSSKYVINEMGIAIDNRTKIDWKRGRGGDLIDLTWEMTRGRPVRFCIMLIIDYFDVHVQNKRNYCYYIILHCFSSTIKY